MKQGQSDSFFSNPNAHLLRKRTRKKCIFGAAKTKLGPYHFVRAFDELFQRAIVGFEKKMFRVLLSMII